MRSPGSSGKRILYPLPTRLASIDRSAAETSDLNDTRPSFGSTETSAAAVWSLSADFLTGHAGQSRVSTP